MYQWFDEEVEQKRCEGEKKTTESEDKRRQKDRKIKERKVFDSQFSSGVQRLEEHSGSRPQWRQNYFRQLISGIHMYIHVYFA